MHTSKKIGNSLLLTTLSITLLSLAGCLSPQIVSASHDSVSIKYDPAIEDAAKIEVLARNYCDKLGWQNAVLVDTTPLINSFGGRTSAYLCVNDKNQ